ncbi:MAG: hypothetical protein LH473_08200 [Chitinophagales bacterium]|nr:hypothetical protein [Chitinophagales bacterium]
MAQAPGYMGRKLSISYTPAFFISLQPKLKENGDYKTHVGLNFRNDVTIDYVISKSVALGGSLKYCSTKLNDVFFYKYAWDFERSQAFTGDVNMHGPAFSVYIKKYSFRKKGFIAPVGFYTKWEFIYGKMKINSGKLLTPQDSNYNYVSDISEISSFESQSFYGLIFSYGRQNFINDRIFINTASSFGITNMGISENVANRNIGDIGNLQRDVKSRISGYLLFNFNIGLGFLL